MRRAIDRSIARAYSFRTDFLFSFFFFKSSITKLANRRNTRSNEFGGKKKVISTFPSAPPFHPRIRYTMDRGHPRERNIVDVEKKKKKKKKYQFQLRRESIISVKGILARFGAEPPPRDRPPHPFRWLWKNVGAREVIDPWLPSGRRSRTTSNGWYESTRADLRSHSGFCSRSASALSPFPSACSAGTIRSFQIFFMKNLHARTPLYTRKNNSGGGENNQSGFCMGWEERKRGVKERQRGERGQRQLCSRDCSLDRRNPIGNCRPIQSRCGFSPLTFRCFTKYQKLIVQSFFFIQLFTQFFIHTCTGNQTWIRVSTLIWVYKWKSLSLSKYR